MSGDMAGFKAAATPQALELVGMSLDAALYKMRMIALLALGCKHSHQEVRGGGGGAPGGVGGGPGGDGGVCVGIPAAAFLLTYLLLPLLLSAADL